MQIEHRPVEGMLVEGSIRYLLTRPDVLMGVAHHMGRGRELEFLTALEASTFSNAQSSFDTYKAHRQFDDADFLASISSMANKLGWGSWQFKDDADGTRVVLVEYSPFAAGYGSSPHPVCAPIKGVLRASALVGYGQAVTVEETECAAQGHKRCCFRIKPLE